MLEGINPVLEDAPPVGQKGIRERNREGSGKTDLPAYDTTTFLLGLLVGSLRERQRM